MERQCWAFNHQYQRCTLNANHNGDHSIQTTWTDEECAWAEPAISKKPSAPAPSVTDMSATPPKDTPCIACNHRHKDGECKCGCYSFIG